MAEKAPRDEGAVDAVALELLAGLAAEDRHHRILTACASLMGVDHAALLVRRGRTFRALATTGSSLAAQPDVGLAVSEEDLSGGRPVRFGGAEFGFVATALGWPQAAVDLALVEVGLPGETSAALVVGGEKLPALADDGVRTAASLLEVAWGTVRQVDALAEDSRQYERVAQDLQVQAGERAASLLLGDSVPVRALRKAIETAASDASRHVLLIGQPGSGCEAAARAIHAASERSARPFVVVRCPMISRPEELLGGSGRGGTEVLGRARLAEGGTLYLADVGALPPDVQESLYRKLSVDALNLRIVAMARRRPRLHPGLVDLFAAPIKIPPLTRRRDDLPVLVDHFVRLHASRLGKTVSSLSPESMARLEAYAWPGNVVELEGVLERVVLSAKGDVASVSESMLDADPALGSYRLVRKLGQGGMGEVWLAEHEHLARPAVVKLIHSQQAGDDELEKRFRREARALANLTSPHTVELYEFGINPEGHFFYVMEFLEGQDLEQLVKRTGPVPPNRLVSIATQVCDSLAEAHARGRAHRDIKPANIMLCRQGLQEDFVKVLDFGMVSALASEDESVTRNGQVRGSPGYMAPEHAEGELTVDGRADLYSLGCVLFELATGHKVFEARSAMHALMQHVMEAPRAPSAVTDRPIPPELDRVILQCLEKDPTKRPASALELREMLLQVPVQAPWTREDARRWWETHAVRNTEPPAFTTTVVAPE